MEIGPAQLSSQLDAILAQPSAVGYEPRAAQTSSGPTESMAVEELSMGQELLEKARQDGDEENFLESTSENINQVVAELGFNVTFKVKVSASTGAFYVEVRDKYDGRLVKTIPPQEMVAVREKMQQVLKGLLVNDKT